MVVGSRRELRLTASRETHLADLRPTPAYFQILPATVNEHLRGHWEGHCEQGENEGSQSSQKGHRFRFVVLQPVRNQEALPPRLMCLASLNSQRQAFGYREVFLYLSIG